MPEFAEIRSEGQPPNNFRSQDSSDDLRRTASGQSSRSSSRQPRPLHRIISAQHLDDQSLYHHHEADHDGEDDATDAENGGHAEGEDADGDDLHRDSSAGTAADSDSNSIHDNEKSTTAAPTSSDRRDPEKAYPDQQLKKSKSRASSKSARDPNLVTWEGPDDPDNPKNWSSTRKFFAVMVVASFTFISPVSSSMVAPSIQAIAKEFDITNEVEQQMVLSVFVLAYAIGPLFLGPLSEIYGRVPVLQLANLIYLIFDAACGGARNKGMMIAFRFLSGLGGSAPLAIGGGVLSDIFMPEQRGRAVAIYSLMPLLGPAIGPIAGGFITLKTTWRWSFYATAIADAVIQLFGLFFLRETWTPKILAKRAEQRRKDTGNEALHTQWQTPDRTLRKVLSGALQRPFRLFVTQPIVQFLAVYMAYLYGLMYLQLATFPTLWSEVYHEDVGIAGLNYISLGVGFFLGTQVSAPLNDRLYRYLKARNGGEGRPEFRVPLMIPASILVPIGLFLYGWSAEYATHWIVPNIGAAIFAAGVIVGFQAIQTYLIDSYTRFAASAVAAATVLRSLAGFGFPLFAPYMFKALGLGWGNSLLGFLAIAIGVPAPLLLWFYGARLRAKSQYAAGS